MYGQPTTGLEVKTSFLPLMFLLYLCTPRIVINGQENRRPWGTHFWPLEPGWYNVKVFYPYLFLPQAGANSIDVYVHPGRVTRVQYSMDVPFVFAKGSIRQV